VKIREADAVELVETTPLERLAELNTEVVYTHVEFLGRELPGPMDLYQRWERQQWSATAIDFSVDREQWAAIHPAVREQLEGTFAGFFFGEQAVTDTLSPLIMGAPDEENRLFLATQVVDEARHSYLFARLYHDVLGVPGGLRDALAHLGEIRGSEGGYGRIFDPQDGELVTLTDAVRLDPGDYGKWVQAITLYHLMVEGLLALPSQRRVLRLLRANDLLPGFRAGFTAVTRDESRHVSYGIWALRQAVRSGHEGDVRAVVDRTLRSCMRVFANPEVKLPDPRVLPPSSRLDPREQWAFAVDSITRRLRSAAVSPDYVQDVDRRAWAVVREGVERYEQIQRTEHPVRAWEREEVQAAAAS
jgi:ribonucleoside-diphosphate reductase beta chain